jgi:hypothetical protein
MLKRFTTLTVDQQGNIQPGRPLPSGTHIVSEDTPRRAVPLVSRSKLATWIDRCVLGDLTTLHDGIRLAERRRLKQKRGGGNYLLAAGCCMALELRGEGGRIRGIDRLHDVVTLHCKMTTWLHGDCISLDAMRRRTPGPARSRARGHPA